ncbi:hypothetical protein ACP70R_039164 [Stipagrostis hirtigluma subsp. patula]
MAAPSPRLPPRGRAPSPPLHAPSPPTSAAAPFASPRPPSRRRPRRGARRCRAAPPPCLRRASGLRFAVLRRPHRRRAGDPARGWGRRSRWEGVRVQVRGCALPRCGRAARVHAAECDG